MGGTVIVRGGVERKGECLLLRGVTGTQVQPEKEAWCELHLKKEKRIGGSNKHLLMEDT